jgi:hypothetical protein
MAPFGTSAHLSLIARARPSAARSRPSDWPNQSRTCAVTTVASAGNATETANSARSNPASSVPRRLSSCPVCDGNPHHDEHAELDVARVGCSYRDIRCGHRVRMHAGGIAASHLTMCGERSPPFDSTLLKRAKGLGAGRPSWGDQGRKISTPLHFQHIAHPWACGKTRVVRQNVRPKPGPAESGIREVRVLAVRAAGPHGAAG